MFLSFRYLIQGPGWTFPPPLLYNLAFWKGFFPHLLLKNWRFPQLATGCSTVCAGALYSIFQVPDWCVFHIGSELNWFKTIFQVRLAGTADVFCLTLHQKGWAASWDLLGIFLNEFIILWSTSDVGNVHLLYCHLLGCYICVFSFFNTGSQDNYREVCFMVACVDWMFWRVQLWHVSHKCPASWTRWPLSEPCVMLWPQIHWWLLRLWFSVSTAYSVMRSWPLTRLLAAMVETNKSL